MCQTAVQDELLDRDPTTGIKVRDQRAREMTILTPAEARRVLAAIDAHFQLLVRTLLDTGLRWGECIALRADDIVRGDDGVWAIRVRRTIAEVNGRQTERPYGKTSATMRDVEIEDDLADELRSAAEGNGHVFHRSARRAAPAQQFPQDLAGGVCRC